MNQPEFILMKEEYDEFIAQNEKEENIRKEIIEIIGPLYDVYNDKLDRESEKRKAEIMDLGNYIRFSNRKMEILNLSEAPDFVALIDGVKTGIELTRIFDAGKFEVIGILESIIKRTASTLLEKYQDAKFLFNIYFTNYPISSLKREGPELLAEYIGSMIEGKKMELPTFFSRVTMSAQNELQLALADNFEIRDIDTSAF